MHLSSQDQYFKKQLQSMAFRYGCKWAEKKLIVFLIRKRPFYSIYLIMKVKILRKKGNGLEMVLIRRARYQFQLDMSLKRRLLPAQVQADAYSSGNWVKSRIIWSQVRFLSVVNIDIPSKCLPHPHFFNRNPNWSLIRQMNKDTQACNFHYLTALQVAMLHNGGYANRNILLFRNREVVK